MNQMRTCAAVIIGLVLTTAWGQDSTTETPKAEGVEVTRIQETRSRDFDRERMTGQISGTNVTLAATGEQAGKAIKYGKLKIEKAFDDKGTDLSLKDNFFGREIVQGFLTTGKSFGPKIENGFAFDIRLGLAKREASKIAHLKGSISVMSGGKKTSATISDLASLAGKEADSPELKAAHVTIKIESVKADKITYTLAGSSEAVQEIELVDADGKTVETSKSSWSMGNGPKTYSMQANTMPAKPALKVTLITDSTIATIPFDLKDIPLP
jgi:hypothetical protein